MSGVLVEEICRVLMQVDLHAAVREVGQGLVMVLPGVGLTLLQLQYGQLEGGDKGCLVVG